MFTTCPLPIRIHTARATGAYTYRVDITSAWGWRWVTGHGDTLAQAVASAVEAWRCRARYSWGGANYYWTAEQKEA